MEEAEEVDETLRETMRQRLMESGKIELPGANLSDEDIQRFDNWNESSTGNYTSAGWTITNGRPNNANAFLAPNGTLQTPALAYEAGSLSFT